MALLSVVRWLYEWIAWTQTPSDTITLADSAGRDIVLTRSESLTLSDSEIEAFVLGKADTVTLSDVGINDIATFENDDLTLDEDPSLDVAPATIAETITLSESETEQYGLQPLDTITLVEDLSKDESESALADTITLSDVSSRIPGLSRSDVLNLADADVIAFFEATGINETITLTESFNSLVTFALTRTDTITLSDAITLLQTVWKRTFTDIITLSDARSTVIAWDRTVNDTIGVNDAINTGFAANYALSFSDSYAISDLASTTSVTLLDAAESLAVTDDISNEAQPKTDESIGVSDVEFSDIGPGPNDTVTASDVSVNTPAPVVSETITLSDTRSNAEAPARSDTTTLSDSSIQSIGYQRFVDDTITITDNLILPTFAQWAISLSDTITLSDVASTANTYDRTTTDTITLSALLAELAPGLGQPDTITLSDTRVSDIGAGRLDTITPSDVITGFVYTRLIADLIQPVDENNQPADVTQSKSDTTTLSDTISLGPGVGIQENDTITLSDAMSTLSAFAPTLTDTTTLIDVIVLSPGANTADTITQSDVITDRTSTWDRTLGDFVLLQDEADTGSGVDRSTSFADTTTLSDVISFAVTTVASDTVTLSDLAAKDVTTVAADTTTLSDAISNEPRPQPFDILHAFGFAPLTVGSTNFTDVGRLSGTTITGDDGRSPEGTVALWERTTNAITNGGFTSNTTGYTTVGSTLTRVFTEHKYGTSSGQVVTSNAGANEGVFHSFTATVARWVGSAWIKPTTSCTVRLRITDNSGTTLHTGTTYSLVANVWQRIAIGTSANLTAATHRLYVETDVQQSLTFYLDGVQAEAKAGSPTKPVPTPYVETNGATVTRNAGSAQFPNSILSTSLGWFAARVRPEWDSDSAYLSTDGNNPIVFRIEVDSNNNLGLQYVTSALRWRLTRTSTVGGAVTSNNENVQAFSAGSTHTIICAWDAGHTYLSVNGSNFVSVANTSGTLNGALPTNWEIGRRLSSSTGGFGGEFLWAAWGSGTALTNALVATLYATSDTGPDVLPLQSPYFIWPANDEYIQASQPMTFSIGFNVDQADSTTVSDLDENDPNPIRSDSLSVSDAIVGLDVATNPSDTTTLSDATSIANFALNLSDVLFMSDNRVSEIAPSQDDSLSMSDFSRSDYLQNNNESLSVSDVWQTEDDQIAGDTITLSDTSATTNAWTRSFADTITITETIRRTPTAKAIDTITLSDVRSVVDSLARTDSLGVSDAVQPEDDVIMGDTLTLDDPMSTTSESYRDTADSVTFDDDASLAYIIVLEESIELNDAVDSVLDIALIFDEEIDLITLVNLLATQILGLSDTVHMQDIAGKALTRPPRNDTVTLHDTFGRGTGFPVNETITITDNIAKFGYGHIVPETISMSDDTETLLDIKRTFIDGVSLQDKVGKAVALTFSDRIFPADAINAGRIITLVFNEGVTLVDHAYPSFAVHDTVTLYDSQNIVYVHGIGFVLDLDDGISLDDDLATNYDIARAQSFLIAGEERQPLSQSVVRIGKRPTTQIGIKTPHGRIGTRVR
jgi:hypothetical protein